MAARSCRFLYSSSPIATASTTSPLLSPTLSAAEATTSRRRLLLSSTCGTIAVAAAAAMEGAPAASGGKGSATVVDSHLHVWASPQQAADKYPYFPGQEPPIRGDVDLLLEENYRAVRFNPNLWPLGQKMTNEVGRSLFAKAGELGAPVGIMVMKGISSYIQEIEELCTDYPKTTVIFDHMAFCKPPTNTEEEKAFTSFLKLSRFPQIYVKYSALFRISREAYPYEETSQLLSRVISSYGANRIMWGSDFPFVVPECGYKGAKEAISHVAGKIPVSSSDLEWILGKTATQLFQGAWVSA